MLNRKVSNYLFYGVLVLIAAVVLLIRSITLGNINEKITNLKNSNVLLQTQNQIIEKQVEEYKDIESDFLYELYKKTPNYFSESELAYYTSAQLESIGINESFDYNRRIYINTGVTFPTGSTFSILKDEFKIVEVQVYFNTMEFEVIDEFVELLYNSNQIFIVNLIEYNSPSGDDVIGVTINFLAFYAIEEEES